MEGHRITREVFYYLHKKIGVHRKSGPAEMSIPKTTVCLKEITAPGENGAFKHYYAKGVAVCSKGDQVIKLEGRSYSGQRASDVAYFFAQQKYSQEKFAKYLKDTAKKPIRFYLWQLLTVDKLNPLEMEKLGLDGLFIRDEQKDDASEAEKQELEKKLVIEKDVNREATVTLEKELDE